MDRRIQKTKAAIREAYFSLLMKKKDARITITEIAKTANIDRKTFYLHYDSVEDISKEFCQEKIEEWLFELEKEVFFERPFDAVKLFHTLNNLIEQDIEFYRQVALHKSYDFFWKQTCDILISTILNVYSEKIDLPSEQLEIYAHFFASGFIAVYQNWLKGNCSLSIDELGEVTGEAAYYGAQKILS